MNFSAFVLFVMIWVVVFFAVLPIGVAPQAKPDEATGWRGAPAAPRMWRKLAITTVIALVIWGVAEVAIVRDWLSFRHGILSAPQN